MLTVLAIESSLLREISDFEPLLSDVKNDGNYKICEWKREGKTLKESIPALFDREFITEGELLSWNILLVSFNPLQYFDNPFDGYYKEPEGAISTPRDVELNEVAKMLGIVSPHSYISKPEDENAECLKHEIKIDYSVREEKRIQYRVDEFARPNKIYLMSVQKKTEIDIEKFPTEGVQKANVYETFSSNGCYPANCRFFKYDILSASNKILMQDYFKLCMTIMSFAYNDGASEMFFAPYNLYSVNSDIDIDVVREKITEVYSRVHFIRKNAESHIDRIRKLREIEYGKEYSVPNLDSSIKVSFESDEKGLYINKGKFGLTKDCPVQDEPQYRYQREKIEKNIKEYLKAPRIAVRKSVSATKENGKYIPTEGRIALNREQMEDLDEYIDALEEEIVKADDIDINYPKENEQERKKADKRVFKTMKMRSTTGAVVGSSLFMFFAFVLAFLPYIINAIIKVRTAETIQGALFITIACVVVMAIAGIITLIILRGPLSDALFHFKKVIDSLVKFVNKQADAYSEYLSKLSGFMKRNSFKRYVLSDASDFMKAEEDLYIVNRDYCIEVENRCKHWADSLRFSIIYNESYATGVFSLDLNPAGNPAFSFVKSDGVFVLKYNGARQLLKTPYEFVEGLNIVREEVYLND